MWFILQFWPCKHWCTIDIPWWRHQMETFSVLLAICAGNSPVTGEFPAQRPVTRSFDIFFDLRLNKRLSKKSWGWWLETLSCPLWRHCNGDRALEPGLLRNCHVKIHVSWQRFQREILLSNPVFCFSGIWPAKCTLQTGRTLVTYPGIPRRSYCVYYITQ